MSSPLTTVDFIEDEVVLDHTFGVSRESYSKLRCMFIAIGDGEYIGLGEATQFMPDVYGSHVDDMLRFEGAVRSLVKESGFVHPTRFYAHLCKAIPGNPFLKCAVDVAYWDLYARRQGKPLYNVLGFDAPVRARSNYSIGLSSISEMQARVRAASNWPVYKVKLGRDDDLHIVRSIREVTDKPLIVDANCGWDVEKARYLIPALYELGVVEVEQPLAVDKWSDMRQIRGVAPIVLTADESCSTLANLERCAGAFDKVNLKLMKCGGITPIIDMLARAKALGLRCMIGCMPETRVGISAICQFAPAVDSIEVDSVCFVVSDHADGVAVSDGLIMLDPKSLGTSAVASGHLKRELSYRHGAGVSI